MIPRIYLDHTATTPVAPDVFDAMRPFFTETFGNASSVHAYGREAKTALEKARGVIATAIGAQPGEIFFTSGGTEADNLALRGAARSLAAKGRKQVVTSAAEHHAVLEPVERLAQEGFTADILPVDHAGRVRMDRLEFVLSEATAVVSVMMANNEVGTISPIRAIADLTHTQGAVVHTDAVQALGKIPVDVNMLGIDLMSLSAHKLYGPKGIGALYIRRGTPLEPLLLGGGQERGTRPGTESVALAVGFARAVEISVASMVDEGKRLQGLRDALRKEIEREFPEVLVNGDNDEGLPHILNISFDDRRIHLEGEMLLVRMDLQGIAASSGSACTSGSVQPSHVLSALGRDAETAKATLRFSFGRSNTADDIPMVVRALKASLGRPV